MFRNFASRGRLAINLSALLLAFVAAFAAGCHSAPASQSSAETSPADWSKWQESRRQSIAGSNGWTTLIALHWLPEGVTSVGADRTNQLVLPKDRAPGFVGTISRSGKSIQFKAAPGVEVKSDGAVVSELAIKTDASDHPTKLKVGTLSFVIIERGERFGVRIRDPESPARQHFAGLKYFPYNSAWRVQGHFEAFPAPQTLRVVDASGGFQELPSPGALVFSHDGKEYKLDAVEEGGDEYFIIFTDASAGASTYEAGRFLYVHKPDAAGNVTIDFNRAFTPPCGFTPFATCPRPPDQNTLPFAVEVGEKKPAEGHEAAL